MPKTIIKIRTWGCQICNYRQDFEPTKEAMNLVFNQDKRFRLNDVKENQCPSCLLKGIVSQMEKTTDLVKKIEHLIMGEEDIEIEIEEKEKVKIMTTVEKTVYRDKRKQDIQEAIIKAREFEE